MPDPLSPKAAPAAGFTSYVEQYSGTVYALSSLLLGKGAGADYAATATFAALYEPCLKGRILAKDFFTTACMECIRQCSLLAPDQREYASVQLSWEDRIVAALRYGLKLPLPEISLILQTNVPVLKAQLRGIREQMTAVQAALPAVPHPSAG